MVSRVHDMELNACFDGIRRGNMDDFERVYHELKTPVYTIALRITGNRWLAEDLLQEFFVRLYQSPPESVRKPRAYLFQTIRNLAIDALREKSGEISTEGAPEEQLLERYLIRMDLEIAISRLELLERQIVVLHLNGGLKFREVAEILDLPLGTVYARYRKAIGRLRDMLDGGMI